jgi:hypothetical protein
MQNTVIRGILVAINGLIFLGTIILNLLAIVYILSTRDKTTIAMLVVNLAIADIIHAGMHKRFIFSTMRFFFVF